MNKIVLVSTLIIGLFATSNAFSQSPFRRMVTAEDFLGKKIPPDVFDIEVDTTGFVYFVYPGSLWKFNGFSAEKEWKLENPYDLIYFYSLHKGYASQILLSGPFGVSHIKGDSLLKFPLPDSIVQLGLRGYESVYTDKEGLLHIAPRNNGYFTIDSLGSVTEVVGKRSGIQGFVVTNLDNGAPFNYSIVSETGQKPYSLYLSETDSNFKFISEINRSINESSLVQYKNSSFMFSNGSTDIIHFDNNGLIHAHTFDHNVIKLFIDSRNVLWVGTADHGFFEVESPNLSSQRQFFSGAAAVITESFDKGLWFKSRDLKFGYIPPSKALNYSDQNGYPELFNIRIVGEANEQVIVINDARDIFGLKDNKVEKLILPDTDPKLGIPRGNRPSGHFCYDKETKRTWFARNDELLGWNGADWEILKFEKNEFRKLKVSVLNAQSDGRLIGATQYEFFEIKNGKINRISESLNSIIQDFTIDEYDKIWVTSEEGLWTLENGKFKRPFKNMPEELLTQSIFIAYSQGVVWVQPLNNALFLIKNDSVIPVFDQYGKRLNLYAHSVSPNGDLWATYEENGKFCQIKIKGDTIYCQYYEFDDQAILGLHSSALLATHNEIFIGSKYGLYKQSISELTTEKIPCRALIEEVRINHEMVPLNSSYKLPFNENYINITFNGISFRRIPVEYSYQMEGIDTVWRETEHNQVQYTNLFPGEYNFNLRMKTIRTDWTKPIGIHFSIEKPYWETWWFRIGAILLFLLIIGLGLRFRIVHVRKKEEEKGRIALELSRLELRALKAQMNPHFIFNVLKSIQNRIIKGSKWEANELLVRFSKLIRSSLENSRSEFISVTEEIDFLRNYLEIEKQRIPEKFDFRIIIDEVDELQDVLVPSMMIQPICENAINYAFEDAKGELTIELKLLNEDIFEVIVSDNGKGYFNMRKSINEHHKSHGLEIVQSRLDLFKSNNYDTSMQIEAMDKGTKKGTKITLKLPCK